MSIIGAGDSEADSSSSISSASFYSLDSDRSPDSNAAESTTPTADYDGLLAKIDAQLSSVTQDYSVIPAPHTSNPFLTACGTIFLKTNTEDLATEVPTYFAIYKILLTSQSVQFFPYSRKRKGQTVFEVDANKNTLRRVVDWLNYPRDLDISDFTADELLAMMLVAYDLRIGKLHDDIVSLLINRHTGNVLFRRKPRGFTPQESSVQRAYVKTAASSSARKLCAYLLAFAGHVVHVEGLAWKQELYRDIKSWDDRAKKLGFRKKMPASAFFFENQKSAMELDRVKVEACEVTTAEKHNEAQSSTATAVSAEESLGSIDTFHTP